MIIIYLFDTGFLTLALTNNLPMKWVRPWNEIKKKKKRGYLIEPIIAELFYQLIIKKGFKKEEAKVSIIKLKSLDAINILSLDDNDSIKAGSFHLRFKLSLVDCFLLAVAQKNRLKIYTTDGPLRQSSNKIKIQCDYLPI